MIKIVTAFLLALIFTASAQAVSREKILRIPELKNHADKLEAPLAHIPDDVFHSCMPKLRAARKTTKPALKGWQLYPWVLQTCPEVTPYAAQAVTTYLNTVLKKK